MIYDYWTYMSGQSRFQADEKLGFYRAFEQIAQTVYDHTVYDRSKAREKTRDEYRDLILSRRKIPKKAIDLKDDLGLEPSTDLAIDDFPPDSAMWHIEFTLDKDYISQDDTTLYPIDNPVRKEHVLKLPMVASTGWKGALRSAFRLFHGVDDNHEMVNRLFGSASEEDESKGQAGRLYFFPTYFDQLGLIVINPHDRETGTGKNPIYFETVPPNTKGKFLLLYVPRRGDSGDEIKEDIRMTTQAIQAMFCIYGFGAKTSNGFGLAKDECDSVFRLNRKESTPMLPELQKPVEPEIVQIFQEKYPGEIEMKPKAWGEKFKDTGRDKGEHKRARAAYVTYQEQIEAYEAELAKQEIIEMEPPALVTEKEFSSFDKMVEEIIQLMEGVQK